MCSQIGRDGSQSPRVRSVNKRVGKKLNDNTKRVNTSLLDGASRIRREAWGEQPPAPTASGLVEHLSDPESDFEVGGGSKVRVRRSGFTPEMRDLSVSPFMGLEEDIAPNSDVEYAGKSRTRRAKIGGETDTDRIIDENEWDQLSDQLRRSFDSRAAGVSRSNDVISLFVSLAGLDSKLEHSGGGGFKSDVADSVSRISDESSSSDTSLDAAKFREIGIADISGGAKSGQAVVLHTSNGSISNRSTHQQKNYKKDTAKDIMNNATKYLDAGEINERYRIQNFKDLKILMSAAKKSLDPRKAEAFLSIYNQQVSPKLTTEMDVFEYLTIKIAYLHLKLDNIIKLNIIPDFSLIGNIDRSTKYASNYKVDKEFINDLGMVAYGLIPVNDSGVKIEDHTPILLFRGTALGMDKSAKQVGHEKGIRADLDQQGIGYSAFKEAESDLAEWITLNPNTAVMGHSLGGAFAYRMACSTALSDDVRENLTITVFQAPGIDTKTVINNKVPSKNIVGQFGKGDVVPYAGEKHLNGDYNFTHSAASDIKKSHLETPNVKSQLNNQESVRQLARGGIDPDQAAEGFRKFISLLTPPKKT